MPKNMIFMTFTLKVKVQNLIIFIIGKDKAFLKF